MQITENSETLKFNHFFPFIHWKFHAALKIIIFNVFIALLFPVWHITHFTNLIVNNLNLGMRNQNCIFHILKCAQKSRRKKFNRAPHPHEIILYIKIQDFSSIVGKNWKVYISSFILNFSFELSLFEGRILILLKHRLTFPLVHKGSRSTRNYVYFLHRAITSLLNYVHGDDNYLCCTFLPHFNDNLPTFSSPSPWVDREMKCVNNFFHFSLTVVCFSSKCVPWNCKKNFPSSQLYIFFSFSLVHSRIQKHSVNEPPRENHLAKHEFSFTEIFVNIQF